MKVMNLEGSGGGARCLPSWPPSPEIRTALSKFTDFQVFDFRISEKFFGWRGDVKDMASTHREKFEAAEAEFQGKVVTESVIALTVTIEVRRYRKPVVRFFRCRHMDGRYNTENR